MKPVYSDDYLLVDPRAVVLAQPFDGDGPHDGTYVLMLHIGVGSTLYEAYVRYPTLEERNTAFSQICHLRRALTESLPLALDFGLDAEDIEDEEE